MCVFVCVVLEQPAHETLVHLDRLKSFPKFLHRWVLKCQSGKTVCHATIHTHKKKKRRDLPKSDKKTQQVIQEKTHSKKDKQHLTFMSLT